MEPRSHPTTRERRRGERNVWRTGLALSVLIHLLVFVAWPVEYDPISPHAAAGPRSGDPAPAGGDMQAVNVRTPQPRRIVPPPIPVPAVEPVVDLDFEEEPAMDEAQILGERPGTEGPGVEDGSGEGDGGTSDEGLYRMVPPSPRGMIVPPSSDELRGTEVEVWVFVDETGRVVPDSTRLEPPTGNRDFDRRLIQEASEWVFEPARRGGEPVAAWFPYTISM